MTRFHLLSSALAVGATLMTGVVSARDLGREPFMAAQAAGVQTSMEGPAAIDGRIILIDSELPGMRPDGASETAVIQLAESSLSPTVKPEASVADPPDPMDAEACYHLGVQFAEGLTVPQNDVEAVKWFRMAAEQGHAQAQYQLGRKFSSGKGVPEDQVEAMTWFRRAAEQGLVDAQFALGWMLRWKIGVPHGWELSYDQEAIKWFRRAADQGHVAAQLALGDMFSFSFYHSGMGYAPDPREAARWYRRAADQGDAQGQYKLGKMYANGKGVSKDVQEAVRWLHLAAEQGHAAAQRLLESLQNGPAEYMYTNPFPGQGTGGDRCCEK